MSHSKETEQTLIDSIKHLLKDNKIVQKMFSDFGVDIDELDNMPVEFAKIKPSAKTKNGKVILNEKLLEDGDFKDDIHYIVHEAKHWLQQKFSRDDKYKHDDSLDYLDLPAEIEAFTVQIAFMKDFYGDSYAKEYLEELLNFHQLEGKERNRKRDQLMG